MCRDCYELDLPEPTWAEAFQENKEMITNAGLLLIVPLGIFIGSCILSYKLSKESKVNLTELNTRLKKARRTVDTRIAEARVIATKGVSIKQEIQLASADVDLYNKVAITLASIGEQRQADAQQQIEQLVTRGLTSIFAEDISFHLVQTQRGKTPEVKFLVKSRGLNGHEIETSVMDSRGGGLAAVVGFLLRLVVMLLSKDKNNPVLILDESFSHVSAEYERPLAEFIKELVDKTPVQLILVTHSDAFSEFADKRYRLKLNNGTTKAEEF